MDFIRMSTRRVRHIEDDWFLSKSLHHLKKLLDLSLLYAGWLGNLEVIDQVFFLVRAAEEQKNWTRFVRFTFEDICSINDATVSNNTN